MKFAFRVAAISIVSRAETARNHGVHLVEDYQTVENRELLKDLRAQPALRTGNLLIIEPPAPIAIDAAKMDRHVPLAPAELVYAELRYRGTEQALEAADQLLPRLTGGVAAANPATRLRQ